MAAAAAVLVLATGGVIVDVAPAEAATLGAGWDIGPGWLGSYRTEAGVYVYCAEVDHNPGPTAGVTDGGALYGAGWAKYGGGSVTATEATRLNYVLSRYGQTSSPHQAAAIQMYIWSVISPNTYNSHSPWTGDQYYITRAPSRARATIQNLLNQFRAEAATIQPPSSTVTGSASLSVHMTDAYTGSVTVTTSPANAVGTLSLVGATVTATGGASTSVVNGSVIPITGNPLDKDLKYAIHASANFTASVAGGYAANFRIHTTGDGRAQKTISHGQPGVATISFAAADFVTDPLPLEFAPVVSTQVSSRIIKAGDTFSDRVTFSSHPDYSPWRQFRDDSYAKITARGTVYGPFTAPPVEADTVPAGAPVAGTATITTSEVDGPKVEYVATTAETAKESGYYTWVWTIAASDHGAATQAQLPLGYAYADRFGQVAETQVASFRLTGVSQMADSELPLSGSTSDTFTPEASGGEWLEDSTGPIPVTLRATSYFVPGDPDTALPVSEAPTADAEVVAVERVVTTGVAVTTAQAIVADSYRAGHVTTQWCVLDEDQPTEFQGFVVEWCDEFGLANETAAVRPPVVRTQAQEALVLWSDATQETFDTAIVSGAVPGEPMQLSFAAYREVYDLDGVPVCDATNLIWESSTPIQVSKAGSYNSEPFTPADLVPAALLPTLGSDTPLAIWFIESATDQAGNVIAAGQCGLENETTKMHNPDMRSEATAALVYGGLAYDTAFLDGTAPSGSTISFAAYAHKAGAATPVCSADNRVWESTVPSPVVSGETSYRSEGARLPVGINLWVATLHAPNGDVLRQGACGEEFEVTIVDPPACLPVTGHGVAAPLIGGAVILVVAGGLLLVGGRRRRGMVIITAVVLVGLVAGVGITAPAPAHAALGCGPQGLIFNPVGRVTPGPNVEPPAVMATSGQVSGDGVVAFAAASTAAAEDLDPKAFPWLETGATSSTTVTDVQAWVEGDPVPVSQAGWVATNDGTEFGLANPAAVIGDGAYATANRLLNDGRITATIDGVPVNTLVMKNLGAPATAAPTITSSALPPSTLGTGYSAPVAGTGTGVTWSVSAGSLPAGLILDGSTGEISGTPTTVGASTFTISAANTGGTVKRQLAISVLDVTPTITSSALPPATLGTGYSALVAGTGTGVTWSVSAGSLPAGLILDGSTGEISGTPTTTGVRAFTVKATNTAGTASRAFTIDVLEVAPTISTATLPVATVGDAYLAELATTGVAVRWKLTAGTLPVGMTLDESSGEVSGTPTVSGSSTFTIAVSNTGGMDSREFTLEVVDVRPVVTTTALPDATVDAEYLAPLVATGLDATWSITAGSLPAGLALDASTGEITGTPTASGMFSFTVAATNSGGSDESELAIEVLEIAPTITDTSLANAMYGTVYTATIGSTGVAVTWSVTSGALPAGLALDASTGEISGTPTEGGVFDFTVVVSNNGGSAEQVLTIIVELAAPAAPASATMTSAALSWPPVTCVTGTPEYDWRVAMDGATISTAPWTATAATTTAVTTHEGGTSNAEVRARCTIGALDSAESASATATISRTVSTPGITGLAKGSDFYGIQWSPLACAAGTEARYQYQIYRQGGGGGEALNETGGVTPDRTFRFWRQLNIGSYTVHHKTWYYCMNPRTGVKGTTRVQGTQWLGTGAAGGNGYPVRYDW